jgi:hypothetical protein
MKSASFLPKLFRWVFTIFGVLSGIAVVAVIAVMIVDPSLPAGAHFGPVKGEVLGQSAEFALHAATDGTSEPVFSAKAFNGSVTMIVEKAGGMVALLKRYGLPLILINALFLAALFELLRRLFRNVGRGDSFTPQSVHLVQAVGMLLLVFSVVSGLAENWFAWAAYDYFSQHTQIVVSGTPVRLPPAADHPLWFGDKSVFGHPVFFSGLLVLALAEVFRQGLALKRDNDLTV